MFFHDMKLLERVFWLKRIKGSGNPMHEATSTSGSFVTDVVAPLKKLLLTLSPIQSGSGDPSPSNVRPISGHTDVDTEVCGVNVWDEEWELGIIKDTDGEYASNTTRICSKNYTPIIGGASYYIHNGSNQEMGIFVYDSEYNYIGAWKSSTWQKGNGTSNATNSVITTPSDARYMKIRTVPAYGTTYKNDISINYPSTDHDYHAHDGNTYTTDLGRTVYGGTLDVVSGELVVDRIFETVDGARITRVSKDGDVWRVTPNPNLTPSGRGYTDGISNIYPWSTSWGGISGMTIGVAVNNSRGDEFLIRDDSLTSLTDFRTRFNETPIQLCYELATPQTYQLTPQQINSLVGQNNIITEDGVEVSEIVYLTRLVGSPLLGSPQTEDEPTEETNEEPIEETEEPEGE